MATPPVALASSGTSKPLVPVCWNVTSNTDALAFHATASASILLRASSAASMLAAVSAGEAPTLMLPVSRPAKLSLKGAAPL